MRDGWLWIRRTGCSSEVNPMRIDVITIFPEYLRPMREALLGKAIDRGRIELGVHDLREWAHDVHRSVDDSPYGGGPGMVMKPDVWGEALDEVCGSSGEDEPPLLVVPSPAGTPFTQATAQRYAQRSRVVFACGRYEGIDQRAIEDAQRRMPVEEVSIGDYVLVGGEVAVLVIVEAVCRLLPGVLGNPASAQQDSFSDGLLEGPCYTRPEVWRELTVPDVLLSGDHAKIRRWRRDRALERTAQRRPDLLATLADTELSAADHQLLEEVEDNVDQSEQ